MKSSIALLKLLLYLAPLFSWANDGAYKYDVSIRSFANTGRHSYGGVKIAKIDEDTILSSSRFDNSIRSWSLKRQATTNVAFLYSHEGSITLGGCVSGDYIYVFQRQDDNVVRIYTLNKLNLQEISFGMLNIKFATQMECSNSQEYAFIGGQKTISLVSLKTLNITDSVLMGNEIASISSHPLLRRFVALDVRGEVSQFLYDKGRIAVIKTKSISFAGNIPVAQIKYSPLGDLLAISNYGYGLKLLDDQDLIDRGAWESISAGVRATQRLPELAWKNNREIVSGGEAEPMVRYVNNKRELANVTGKYENPISDVTSIVVMDKTTVVSRVDGQLYIMSKGENSKRDFLPAIPPRRISKLSFGNNSDLDFEVTLKSDYFDFIKKESGTDVHDSSNAHRDQYSNFRLTPAGEVTNAEKFKTMNCASLLRSTNFSGYVKGASESNGPYLESASDKQRAFFTEWPIHISHYWGDCVDKDGRYVAFASDAGLTLYMGNDHKEWFSRTNSPALDVAISPNKKYVVAICADGTLEWHQFETGKLLWTMNYSKSGWQISLPTGYFSGSIAAFGSLEYRVEGRDGKTWFLDGRNYFDVFFRPDLVAATISGEYSYVDRVTNENSILDAVKSPPPLVRIALLLPQISDGHLVVPYTVNNTGGGVGEVLVLHNGKLVKSDGFYKDAPGSSLVAINTTRATSTVEVAKGVRKMLGDVESRPGNSATGNRDSVVVRQAKPKALNAAGEFTDSVEIDVIPGEDNEITVMARNADNTILGQGQTVRFKSSLPKAEPHLWLLPVGIASFQDRGVRKLLSPKKDALDFACSYGGKEALKSAGINCDKPGYASSLFKSANIHVVDPLTNEKATRANILAKLDEIAAKAKPTDTFIWFVSSHGTMDANSVYGIVPFDAKCQDPKCDAASGLVSSNDILEKSKAIKAMKQLLILDTCQAGGLDNKMSGLYDARMSGLAKNMGLHLYAAATSTESALDGQDANKNSIFTATLLEGLAGASAKNTEGQISIIPLGQYVKINTAETSRKVYPKDTPQTPVIQHFGKDAPLAGMATR